VDGIIAPVVKLKAEKSSPIYTVIYENSPNSTSKKLLSKHDYLIQLFGAANMSEH
jgi:hypothetical protein